MSRTARSEDNKLPIDSRNSNPITSDAGTPLLITVRPPSTSLELKTDPGVPIVYAGFGALMHTTCISFLSHAQIWTVQDGAAVVVGEKTNRAKVEFLEEMNRLLDQVPEIVNSSSARQS
ncbi:copper chaperone [Sarracenia purpurea var. burkii]